MTDLLTSCEDFKMSIDIMSMRARRTLSEKVITSESLVEDTELKENAIVAKKSIYNVLKSIEDLKTNNVEKLSKDFNFDMTSISFNKLYQSIKDLLSNKDTNIKIKEAENGEKYLEGEIVNRLMEFVNTIVDEKYFTDKVNYSNRAVNGIIKLLEDKNTTMSVVSSLINKIITELSKEEDVDYIMIENTIDEIVKTADISIYSNIHINLDEVKRFPKELLRLKNIDLKTFDIEKSAEFKTSSGKVCYLLKIKEFKHLIFPISAVISDIDPKGKGKIFDVDELDKIYEVCNKYLTNIMKLVDFFKDSYVNSFSKTIEDSLNKLDTLMNSSFYTNSDRMSKDKIYLSSIFELLTHAGDSINVDLLAINELAKLNNFFYDYLDEVTKYYSE